MVLVAVLGAIGPMDPADDLLGGLSFLESIGEPPRVPGHVGILPGDGPVTVATELAKYRSVRPMVLAGWRRMSMIRLVCRTSAAPIAAEPTDRPIDSASFERVTVLAHYGRRSRPSHGR